MTQDFSPITPPPELVQQWARTFYETTTAPGDWAIATATQAARWGADQELEACCEWVSQFNYGDCSYQERLRAARRPKPPSLKEQALTQVESFACSMETLGMDSDLIRRALESLPE